MANPNIVNVSRIIGKTLANALTTSSAVLVANPSSSGNIFKINSVIISNIFSSAAANATISYNTNSAGSGTSTRIVKDISIPGYASIVVVDKGTSLYLEENTSLVGQASSNSNVEVIVGFEQIGE